MSKITLSFIESQIAKISKSEIKAFLGRQRLRFSTREIAVYVFAIYRSQKDMTSFKKTYKLFAKKNLITSCYQGFMYSIGVCATLSEELFKRTVKVFSKNQETLCVDTSFLLQKTAHCIDFAKDKDRVVSRGKGQNFCGVKLLLVSNTRRDILYVDALSVKTHDAKIISYDFVEKLKKFNPKYALFDKGFGGDRNREIVREFSILPVIPFRKNQSQKLTKREENLYRKRFLIEDIFKKLKDIQGDYRLVLKNTKRISIVRAKVFLACMDYNLNRKPFLTWICFWLTLDSLFINIWTVLLITSSWFYFRIYIFVFGFSGAF